MLNRSAGRPPAAESPHGREAILRATRELLAERGLDRVTLREVAERAGVKAPLVHYYFGSKRELLHAVVVELSEGLRDRLAGVGEQAGAPDERLRAFLSHLIQTLAAEPYLPQLVAQLILFPDDERTDRFMRDFGRPNLAVLESILAEGERDGSLRAADLRCMTPVVMGLSLFYFLGAPGLRRLLDFDPLVPESVEHYATGVADLLLDGLRTGAER